MKINKEALKYYNVTILQYRQWCIKNKKSISSVKTKNEFFKKLANKKIIIKNDKLMEISCDDRCESN